MSGRRIHPQLFGLTLAISLFVACLPQGLLADDDEDPKALRDFNTAAELQNSGLYARAGEKWKAYIATYQNDGRLDRATYNLGVSRLHTKQYDDAITAFATVLSKYPKFAKVAALQYNLGMAHYLKGAQSQQAEDYRNAAKAFTTVAEKHADSKYADRALYFQGEALFTVGDGEPSRKAFATLVQKYPESALLPDAYYALGTAQQAAELYDDAIKTYTAFLARNELKAHEYAAEIELRLAMSLFATEQFADAEQRFANVAKLEDFPNADFAMLRQAQCHFELDDLAKAAELNLAIVKQYPESPYLPTAQLAAGKCFYQLGKLSEARNALEPLTKTNGAVQQEASYWLGRTLLREEKPLDALKLLEQVAGNIAADHAFAPHIKLARLDSMYAIAERRAEAGPLYAAFAQQYGDHELAAQAQYMAALASLEQEDFAAARKHAETYLAKEAWKAKSFTPAVLFVAAEAHLLGVENESEGASLAKAQQYYEKLVQEYPTDSRIARAQLRIGWITSRNGKHADAAKYLAGIVDRLEQPEHKAEANLMIGRSLLEAQQQADAIRPLEQALAAKSDWTRTDEVLLLLAQAYRSQQKPNEAVTQLKRIESQYKQSRYRGHAIYLLGEIAQQQSNWDDAVKWYQAVLSNHKEDSYAPLAAYGLGAVRIAQQQYDNAEQAFTQLLDAYPAAETITLAQYWRGVARHRLKKFAPAITDLQQFVAEVQKQSTAAEEAKLADAHYTIALCQIGADQLPAATTTLTALLKEYPNYQQRDNAYYELGHAQLAAKQREEATVAFENLVAAAPESPLAAEAYFHIGTAREQQAAEVSDEQARKQQLAEAETAYATGEKLAKRPELKEKLAYKLGDMQFRQDKFTEAVAVHLGQLKAFPQGELAGAARFLAAESLFRLNKFEEALPLFEEVAAQKVEPYTAQAYYRAGASAAAVKDWQASEKAFSKLLEQHEDFAQAPEAQYGVAWALQNQNKTDEAIKLYEQVAAESTSETAAKARFMVGEIAFGKKAYDQAIEHFLEAAAGYPYPQWQGLARLEAGRCFMQLKKPAEAKKQFQIIADRFPQHEKAADAARLLAELNK